MFTGIVEEIGTIKKIQGGSKSSTITISADKVLSDVKIGDSICTQGVCLTVTSFSKGEFTVDVMAETMRRSTFVDMQGGERVNLERALAVGDRLGGHMVSGHIDGTGEIIAYEREENAVWVSIQADKKILKYMIPKGSIAIDGISLTVAELADSYFRVSVIPHTGEETTLLKRKIGDKVNLENDLVGKYIERFAGFRAEEKNEESSKINMDFLSKHGFI